MKGSWKLGRMFGIGIYVHWTFLLLPAYVLLTNLEGGLRSALLKLGLVLAIFACIILHEFGHILTARPFGISTESVLILPIGGLAKLKGMFYANPWQEILIAIAGPAVNIVIAGIVGLVLAFRTEFFPTGKVEFLSSAEQFLVYLFGANILIVLFNMLPVFPMDGGRVFRALLTMWLGLLRATELAAGIASVIAKTVVLIVVVNVIMHVLGKPAWPFFDPMLAIVALAVMFFGQQELAMVRHLEALRNAPPIEVLPASGPFLDPSAVPDVPNFTGFTWDRRARVWIQWHNGRPIYTC